MTAQARAANPKPIDPERSCVVAKLHSDMADTILFLLRDESETRRWARLLARSLDAIPLAEQSFAVHLSGDLGAGKTAIARALLRELGISGPVKSPTFTLLEPYNSPSFNAYHFDLYRFSSPHQWFDAGFDDIIANPGLSLIEWPENASGALPSPDLRLRIDVPDEDDSSRRLHAEAFSDAARRCLTEIEHGWSASTQTPPD